MSFFRLSWATRAMRLCGTAGRAGPGLFVVMRPIMSPDKSPCMTTPVRIWSDFV
jgi:hypothetical protein